MKIGWLRQNTLTICPAAIGPRSISTGAPAATVEASGFICVMSGTSAAAVPTAATEPVAIYRKSRRVGSAEDIVVTFAIPFLSPRSTHTRTGRGPLPARIIGAPRQWRANLPLSIPGTGGQAARPSGVLLAPLTGE